MACGPLSCGDTLNQDYRLCLNGVTGAEIAQAFIGFALDIDKIRANLQVDRNICHHRCRMRGYFGLLGDECGVDIDRSPALFPEQGNRRTQQNPAISALVTRVSIGEMAANIAQGSRAE
jgi:hypothetical protein